MKKEGLTKLAYSINEFIETSSLSRYKVYKEIKSGNLKARKLGGRTVIILSDAIAYFEALPELES